MVSLPSNVIAFHSLMSHTSLVVCQEGLASVLLVELVATEVHQRIAQQLDLDAIGVFEVHRLLDAAIGSGVLPAGLVETCTDLFPPVPRRGDGDVLHAADRLHAGLEAEPWEVEESEQRLVAEVEEEVRRPGVVAVLHQLDEREPEDVLVERGRALAVGADQGGVVDASAGRVPLLDGLEVLLPQLRTPCFQLGLLALGGLCHRSPFASETGESFNNLTVARDAETGKPPRAQARGGLRASASGGQPGGGLVLPVGRGGAGGGAGVGA